jgi:hypothetical protein
MSRKGGTGVELIGSQLGRSRRMSEIEQLEQRIKGLSPQDLAKFRAWFVEYDARVWDAQIEADSKAGKLDDLVKDALTDYKAGKAREL